MLFHSGYMVFTMKLSLNGIGTILSSQVFIVMKVYI